MSAQWQNKLATGVLWLAGFLIIGIFLFKGLCSYGQVILMSSIGMRIVTDLRNKHQNV